MPASAGTSPGSSSKLTRPDLPLPRLGGGGPAARPSVRGENWHRFHYPIGVFLVAYGVTGLVTGLIGWGDRREELAGYVGSGLAAPTLLAVKAVEVLLIAVALSGLLRHRDVWFLPALFGWAAGFGAFALLDVFKGKWGALAEHSLYLMLFAALLVASYRLSVQARRGGLAPIGETAPAGDAAPVAGQAAAPARQEIPKPPTVPETPDRNEISVSPEAPPVGGETLIDLEAVETPAEAEAEVEAAAEVEAPVEPVAPTGGETLVDLEALTDEEPSADADAPVDEDTSPDVEVPDIPEAPVGEETTLEAETDAGDETPAEEEAPAGEDVSTGSDTLADLEVPAEEPEPVPEGEPDPEPEKARGGDGRNDTQEFAPSALSRRRKR